MTFLDGLKDTGLALIQGLCVAVVLFAVVFACPAGIFAAAWVFMK